MNVNKVDLIEKGFLAIPIPEQTDIVAEIAKMKKEKNAIILAHYYQSSEIQDIADFIGDSLALSQYAENNDADIIVFAGVHFMAETAKTLSPQKKVLIPDLKAGCSLADSCPADEFSDFVAKHPGYTVVSYINTTNEIKALTDIIVTSSNATQIVNSLPMDAKIIFAPDRNLGNYINEQTGRNMVLWDGACHVHKQFSLQRILAMKKEYPTAKILAHPECEKPVLLVSDFVGSTTAILNFSKKDASDTYIVATETGILHQMRKSSPEKLFLAAPPDDSTCACNDCSYMKLNTLSKIYNCLKYELPEIVIEEEARLKAYTSIKRMLTISKEIGLL
ncbi:MAG TPA: quinolinate synthase [Bacteroidales bacterium]|nr:quinolinate synthase [Bacteroidales bacterium]